MDHDYPKFHSEELVVRWFLDWLGRADGATDLSAGAPDRTYRFRGDTWFVEVTTAMVNPREMGNAYRSRLRRDPASATVFSSSDLEAFDVEVRASDLVGRIREALENKKHGYGSPDRTHLLIDASSQRVDARATAESVAKLAGAYVPVDYPYAGVALFLAFDPEWNRDFFWLRDG